jgi:hypothetical protein
VLGIGFGKLREACDAVVAFLRPQIKFLRSQWERLPGKDVVGDRIAY